MNRYLLADADIERRTLLALRGNDPVTTHINTIVDYSLLWILAAAEHVKSAGDLVFLRRLWPKMRSLIEFCEARLDENGFLTGKERDWVYIDWAEIDKEGPAAGEQMLLAAAWRAMADLTEKLADEKNEKPADLTKKPADENNEKTPAACGSFYPVRKEPAEEAYRTAAEEWRAKAGRLAEKIDQYYWSETSGAYIDSYTSGKHHISRQTNILSLRTGLADERKKKLIRENVLRKDSVPAIKTPYFQFYALDAMAELGDLDEVMNTIKDYWGGMLARGAVTFWEEFDPAVTGTAQYDMYGDRFGKSLCHAWAASPVYLIARYFIGLSIAEDPDRDFDLHPQLRYFRKLHCTLPVGMEGASVKLGYDGGTLDLFADGCTGMLRIGRQRILIENRKKISLEIRTQWL